MAEMNRSQILNKLKTKAKGGWKKARQVEAKARGGGGFPPGLKGIVAVCREYKLGATKDKQDPYFTLTAIVVEPPELAGRRATFSWFINDSEYATVQDNLDQLSNDIQLIYTETLPEELDGILDVMKEICERGVHLTFKTGQPRKNNKPPNLFIEGLAEGYEDDPKEANDGAASGGEATGDEGGDAVEAGSEGDEAGEGQEGEAGADEAEAWQPQPSDLYNLKAKDGKQTVEVQVQVKAVDEDAQTVDLILTKPLKAKGLKKGLKFNKIGWDKLLEAKG